MSTLGLLVLVLVFGSVVLVVTSLSTLLKRETNISKFAPDWEEEHYKTYERKKRRINPLILILVIIGSITGFGIMFLVTGMFTYSLIGLLIGFLVPSFWGKRHTKKQRQLMLIQLEQTAEIMSSVLRSGSGLVDALERAANEIANPLKSELLTTANEIKLGTSNSIAFQNLASRVDIDQLDILSMAINLQEQGMAVNLSTLLEQIQDNIRYRLSYQRQVRVMTAEYRLAGWIVSALPFVTLFIMRLVMPDIVAPLFNTTLGLVLFTFNTVVIVIGVVWLMKIANVES